MNGIDKDGQCSYIIAYENGDLTQEEELELFQSLVTTGLAWSLQGSYGRRARDLLEAGLIQNKE